MNPRTSRSKIRSATSLARILARSKRKVVFTNGCFDLLHRGHVSYLERARKLGDLLVVALNSDSSVRKLKGPSRPINTLCDRLEVIAALECVDYATWFGEDTPLKIILKLRPEILVKGGDWNPNSADERKYIIGTREVRSWGGKAVALPYIAGKSTTKILEKARNQKTKAGN